MTTKRIHWENVRQYIWLISGLLCLLVAFIFWLITDTKKLVDLDAPIEDVQVQIQPEKVTASVLGTLQDEVRPLTMTTRVVSSGNHSAEFRGTKFFQENKKKYTIELFNAHEEDVIVMFLRKQPVKKDFFYFRLSGDYQTEQYVTSYGVFRTEAEANAQLKQLQIELPASVKPKVVKLGQYLDLVNDLGAEEMQGSNKLYEVKLKPARVPLIDETQIAQSKPSTVSTSSDSKPKSVAPAQSSTNVTATTKTTITRKDQGGNVIGVEQSHTSVEQSKPKEQPKPKEQAVTEKKPVAPVEKKPTATEISDPFN